MARVRFDYIPKDRFLSRRSPVPRAAVAALDILERWALATWVGALGALALLLPLAFATVRDPAQFLAFVSAAIEMVTRLGYVCGSVALVAGTWIAVRSDRRRAWLAPIAVLIMLGLSLGIDRGIIARMHALEGSIGVPVQTLAPADPRRVAYDALHRQSEESFGLELVIGYLAIAFGVRPSNRRHS